MKVSVHPRVYQKRRWIAEDDVVRAAEQPVDSKPRGGSDPPQIVGIGFDTAGRLLEWAAEVRADELLVFHAMEATAKMLKELGIGG